jgi:hypothetical protein
VHNKLEEGRMVDLPYLMRMVAQDLENILQDVPLHEVNPMRFKIQEVTAWLRYKAKELEMLEEERG